MPTKRRGNYKGRLIKRKLKAKEQRSSNAQPRLNQYSWSSNPHRQGVPWRYQKFADINTRETIRRRAATANRTRWGYTPSYPQPKYWGRPTPKTYTRPYTPPVHTKKRLYNGYFYPVKR